MSRDDQVESERRSTAGRRSTGRGGSLFALALVSLGGLLVSALGGYLLVELNSGDRWPPDSAWGRSAASLLLVLVLISALPLGVFGWSLARRGRSLEGALVVLAVPLGAAFQVGLQPRFLEGVGILFAPFFLASLLLSAGKNRRSLAVSAAAVVGWGAIWAGARLPGALEGRLRDAARAGDERRLERLLDWRVDPDSRDDRGVTALMLAVEADDGRTVRALVERGADPDLADRSGVSAKMRAIAGRQSDFTLLFLGFADGEAGEISRPLAGAGAEP